VGTTYRVAWRSSEWYNLFAFRLAAMREGKHQGRQAYQASGFGHPMQTTTFFSYFFPMSHEGNLLPPVARGDYLRFHVYCAQQWPAGNYPMSGVAVKLPHTTGVEILDT